MLNLHAVVDAFTQHACVSVMCVRWAEWTVNVCRCTIIESVHCTTSKQASVRYSIQNKWFCFPVFSHKTREVQTTCTQTINIIVDSIYTSKRTMIFIYRRHQEIVQHFQIPTNFNPIFATVPTLLLHDFFSRVIFT